MSGIHLDAGRKHPKDKKLSEALAEDADRIKARKGLIDKTATLIKAPDEETDANGGLGETMRPTDEQLDRINQFTRRKVTADEVVAFTTLSCNDIEDRDDDKFSTQCIKDFAALEQPFSPVGKSFMLDHAYSVQNAVGRIFGVDTARKSGALFLTNEVYMPNTEQFAPLIEKIDFGISWAVSVGVMLGKDECAISWCKAPFSSWGWWCQNGHDKGLCYIEDGEEDSWGFPAPVDPKTPKAEKCVRIFSEPRDMYELSQVFLGAQYFAALDKEPDFAKVMKSVAKGADVPIIGLSAEEAKELPLRREPKKVSDARRLYGVKELEDGSLVWTDDNDLRWTFDPSNPSDGVMSLGKEVKSSNKEEDDGHEVSSGEDGDGEGAPDLGGDESDSEPGDGGTGSGSDSSSAAGDESGSEPGSDEPGSAVDDEDEEDDDPESENSEDEDDSEEKSVTKEAVLAAARSAGLPASVIDAAKNHSGNGLSPLLRAAVDEISSLRAEKEALTGKAALGDEFLKSLRAEAINWYTKARATEENPKVSVDTFEKLLDRCGDDVDLIRSLTEEQKELAQAKFPAAVRRSTFPIDPNAAQKLPPIEFDEDAETDQKVKRIHG